MKAFSFRLEQALRWRATQVDLEKSRVAEAATLLSQIRSQVEERRRLLLNAAVELSTGANGTALQSGAAWIQRCGREVKELSQRANLAEQALSANLKRLVQANQNMQLLERLKDTEQARWQAGFSRETEAFAAEAFLRQVTIKRQTGA